MSDDVPILSAEEVAEKLRLVWHGTSELSLARRQEIAASHEALRAEVVRLTDRNEAVNYEALSERRRAEFAESEVARLRAALAALADGCDQVAVCGPALDRARALLAVSDTPPQEACPTCGETRRDWVQGPCAADPMAPDPWHDAVSDMDESSVCRCEVTEHAPGCPAWGYST